MTRKVMYWLLAAYVFAIAGFAVWSPLLVGFIVCSFMANWEHGKLA